MMHEIYRNHVAVVNFALYLLISILGAIAVHRWLGERLLDALVKVYGKFNALLHGKRTIGALDALVTVVIFVLGIALIAVEELTSVIHYAIEAVSGEKPSEGTDQLTSLIVVFALAILGMLTSMLIVQQTERHRNRK